MRSAAEGEKLFLENLELIENILRSTTRRLNVRVEEAEEFTSWARLQLMEDDFCLLRKFRGQSKLSTYLVTVIRRLWIDHCNRLWGKWRPSASARQMGTAAVQLERLMACDGLTFHEAAQALRPALAATGQEVDLEAIAVRLPQRRRLRALEISADDWETFGVDGGVESRVEEIDRDALAEALHEGLAELSEEDQRILELRFGQGCTIPQIAAELSLEPKPIYGRIMRILGRLRRVLESSGLGWGKVRALIPWRGRELLPAKRSTDPQ